MLPIPISALDTMAPLTFYYAPMSTAEVTESVLAELDIPDVDKKTLDLAKGDTKKPQFLKVNPNGRVPTIVHEGNAIWESAAITLYLGETFGVSKHLWPGPGPERGQAMKWVIWSNTTLAAAATSLTLALKAGTPEATNQGSKGDSAKEPPGESAKDKAMGDLQAGLKVLDAALEGKPFLLGEYSLADTHLQSFMGWFGMLGVDMQQVPHVAAWRERCGQRPKLTALRAA